MSSDSEPTVGAPDSEPPPSSEAPPSSHELDRAAILQRRNRFIASAVAGLAVLGIEGCDPPPKTSSTTERDESTSVLTATDPTTTEDAPRPSVCLSPVMVEPDAGAEPEAADAGAADAAVDAGLDGGADAGADAGKPDAGAAKPDAGPPPMPCLSPPIKPPPRPCLKMAPPRPCLDMAPED